MVGRTLLIFSTVSDTAASPVKNETQQRFIAVVHELSSPFQKIKLYTVRTCEWKVRKEKA
jgi:hypothetical protein